MFFIEVLVFVLGLVFGSFVSAFSWRYPKGISIAKGRSMCPKCHTKISWYDNIPLLSFLILKAKCRHCKNKISLRYPLIELVTAIGFAMIGYFTLSTGLSLQFVYSILIFLILETIFVIDFENQIIPDSFTFIGILVSVIMMLLIGDQQLLSRLFAGLAAASMLLLIHLATRGRGMGLGDVKFAILGGMITGPKLFLIWMFIAFLTGAIVGIILIIGKKKGLKSQIAFGPFLVLAIPLAVLYGEKILAWFNFS
jgi:leader peptidase (prepilin peptidase)/N-methyltransferase